MILCFILQVESRLLDPQHSCMAAFLGQIKQLS